MVEVEALRWGSPVARLSGSGLDVVLASDVTYVHEALDELTATLAQLLNLSPPPRIILAHEHARTASRRLLSATSGGSRQLARRRGVDCARHCL